MAELPPIKPIRTGMGLWGWILIGAAFIVAIFPGGPIISHFLDRWRYGGEAKKELKARAEWYKFQIAKQLGMDPDRVTYRDLLVAARVNPELKRVVEEVDRKKGDNNRMSMLTTGGATAASFIPIPGAGAITRVGLSIGGAVTGGTVSALMTKERVDPQEVAEAINQQLADAQKQGTDPRQAVTPQLIFMLRVAQYEPLGEEIKKSFGKPFHQMNENEQVVVMKHYPELANACVSEAYAVGTGIVPIQELMASSPNLGGMAGDPNIAPAPSRMDGFASREVRRREQASQGAIVAARSII